MSCESFRLFPFTIPFVFGQLTGFVSFSFSVTFGVPWPAEFADVMKQFQFLTLDLASLSGFFCSLKVRLCNHVQAHPRYICVSGVQLLRHVGGSDYYGVGCGGHDRLSLVRVAAGKKNVETAQGR